MPRAQCATDGLGLQLGLGCLGCFLLYSFVWGLSSECSVGSVEVVEVLPFVEFVVEHFGVVDDDAVEEPVEFFVVDTVSVRLCR